jgi:transposase-like protein
MIREQKILEIYEEENSVAATARRAGTNYQVVNRVLITNGIIPPGNAEIVAKLTERGYTRAEIAKELGIAEKSLKTYLPYDRHSYVVGEKTKNAEKIRHCRERKKEKNENEK